MNSKLHHNIKQKNELQNLSIIISGNLDPSATFVSGTAESVFRETMELLKATEKYSNFIISSGCDIPPNAKLENVDAFFKAVEKYNCR